jgi:hypothetical protein
VTFEDGSRLRVIEWGVFAGSSGVKSISLPPALEAVSSSCFVGASWLKTVTFGRGAKVREFGASAFRGCKGIKAMSVPASVELIGSSCFSGCKGLCKLTFQGRSKLREIRSLPFEGMDEVEIPDSVRIIKCPGTPRPGHRIVLQFGRASQLSEFGFTDKGAQPRAFLRRGLQSLKRMRASLEFDDDCTFSKKRAKKPTSGNGAAAPPPPKQPRAPRAPRMPTAKQLAKESGKQILKRMRAELREHKRMFPGL